jgi:pimeloyl-ACP methyl ester carboxylesterase
MFSTDRREMIKLTAVTGAGAALNSAGMGQSQASVPSSQIEFDHLVTRHRTVRIDGLDIFYREAGRPNAPAVLLLHGFPSSSHMFRHLIPALADRYRVIAPDYPAFGYSSFPSRNVFRYTFAALADIVAKFTDAVGLSNYTLYIQDYGAPIGFRLALARPRSVRALITQNGNAYLEGLSKLWDPLKAYWADPSPRTRAVLEEWLGEDGTRLQYTAGLPDEQIERLAPDTWNLDLKGLSRPGNAEVQIDLFADYRTNVELYPEFQKYLRTKKPPTLILWGKHDPFFTLEGARAFLRDVPSADLELVDGSHFVLETHGPFAAHCIGAFLERVAS